MPDRPTRGVPPTAPPSDRAMSPNGGPDGDAHRSGAGSVGELVGDITQDLGGLVRDEIALAKAELKEEAVKAGRAGGLLAGAGYAGHLLVLFLSLAVMFALGHAVDTAWAALIVAVLWAVASAVLYARGRARLRDVHPAPERTIDTVKEDARWARHPMS
ncbi:phage holin family protein [Kitasatospora sp. NPDC085895]|uniref:phage holin family protein n=1 Tax=Kitasatospora sp. NPDC085895 TaxID=3155057 RepID=UPI00344B4A27